MLALPMSASAAGWHGVKTFKCFFDSAANYDGSEIEKSKNPFGDSSLIIDSIDLEKNTARAIGNAGGDDALIVTHDPMLTLVATTGAGNMVFTTISQTKDKFPIVSSRHMMIGNDLVFSQNYGTCKIFN